MDWKAELLKIGNWVRGAVAAVVSAVSGSIIVVIVDPKVFNFQEGWPHLKDVMFATAIVGAAGYFAKNPMWDSTRNGKP